MYTLEEKFLHRFKSFRFFSIYENPIFMCVFFFYYNWFEFFISFQASFLIPVTRVYFLTIFLFMIQGFAQAIYDLVGNDMILKLWSGISTSPINAMHSGYGIGAIMAILASKNFIVFSAYDRLLTTEKISANSTNSLVTNFVSPSTTPSSLIYNASSISNSTTSMADWEKIDLKIPYWIAAKFSLFVGLLFLIGQFFETKVFSNY